MADPRKIAYTKEGVLMVNSPKRGSEASFSPPKREADGHTRISRIRPQQTWICPASVIPGQEIELCVHELFPPSVKRESRPISLSGSFARAHPLPRWLACLLTTRVSPSLSSAYSSSSSSPLLPLPLPLLLVLLFLKSLWRDAPSPRPPSCLCCLLSVERMHGWTHGWMHGLTNLNSRAPTREQLMWPAPQAPPPPAPPAPTAAEAEAAKKKEEVRTG